MHGGGAKRPSFEKKNRNQVKIEICFKFRLKIKKKKSIQPEIEGAQLCLSCQQLHFHASPQHCLVFIFQRFFITSNL